MKTPFKSPLLLLALAFFGCGSEKIVPFDAVQFENQEWQFDGKAYSGSAADYHENGQMHNLYRYKGGKYHGLAEKWDAEGNKVWESEFEEGDAYRVTQWHANGQKKEEMLRSKAGMDWKKTKWDEAGNEN